MGIVIFLLESQTYFNSKVRDQAIDKPQSGRILQSCSALCPPLRAEFGRVIWFEHWYETALQTREFWGDVLCISIVALTDCYSLLHQEG